MEQFTYKRIGAFSTYTCVIYTRIILKTKIECIIFLIYHALQSPAQIAGHFVGEVDHDPPPELRHAIFDTPIYVKLILRVLFIVRLQFFLADVLDRNVLHRQHHFTEPPLVDDLAKQHATWQYRGSEPDVDAMIDLGL